MSFSYCIYFLFCHIYYPFLRISKNLSPYFSSLCSPTPDTSNISSRVAGRITHIPASVLSANTIYGGTFSSDAISRPFLPLIRGTVIPLISVVISEPSAHLTLHIPDSYPDSCPGSSDSFRRARYRSPSLPRNSSPMHPDTAGFYRFSQIQSG